MYCKIVVVLSLGLVLPSWGVAEDWPQWRGPTRDGVVKGAKLPAQWPKTLTKAWSVPVGEGHSSPVVVGDRVYQHARVGEEEVVRCLQLADGKEVWQKNYPAPYEMNDAARGHGKGPKSTPAVADGRLFTLGISGILSCYETQKGTLLWQKKFDKQFPNTSPLYGTAMSPLIYGKLCIAHVGGHDQGALAAFEVETGKIRWTANQDGPGYASPVLVTLNGFAQVITQTQNKIVSLDPSKGTILWQKDFTTGYDQNSVTALTYQDRLIYSGYEKPLATLKVSGKGTNWRAEDDWSNPSYPVYMSSPLLIGDQIWGMSQKKSGQIFCVNAKTGKTIWDNEGRMGENVALIHASPYVCLLTNEAKWIVLQADAKEYDPVVQYTVADTPTWAHPVLVENQLLIKDLQKLTVWTIGK